MLLLGIWVFIYFCCCSLSAMQCTKRSGIVWATCNREEENVGKPQETKGGRRRKLLCGHHKINKNLKWKMDTKVALNYFC